MHPTAVDLVGHPTVSKGGNGTATLNFNQGDALYTFDPKISGSTKVNFNATGRTVLKTANTYTGGTMINLGVVETGSSSALGTGPLTLNGGALRAKGTLNVGSLTWNAGTIALAPVAGDVINVDGAFTGGAGGGLFSLAPEGLVVNQA